jgi:hypothetical protein
MIAKALACAAFLMGDPVPAAPPHLFTEVPHEVLCERGASNVLDVPCADLAALYQPEVGGILIAERSAFASFADYWSVLVHEACHHVQWTRPEGPPIGAAIELECYKVAERAGLCILEHPLALR